MNKARFTQLEDIYRAVLCQPPENRAQFVIDSCGSDDDLRSEIESLLSYDELHSQFLDSTPDLLIGEAFATDDDEKSEPRKREISHYRIERLIGEGGMGKVYLAEDVKLNRRVALKLLPDALVGDKDRLMRFEREAQAASALNHPNILTVHEFGEDAGVHFIATEFVDGETLRDKIKHIETKEAFDIAIQVASALSAAHQAGITHRDIKPENIMIRHDGYVKVLDFGLAKVSVTDAATGSEDQTKALLKTEPGMIMGTEAYMSPEQARGKKVDARTDIWSLGVVVYEMLAGERPFSGESRADVIASVITSEPRPISNFARGLPAEADWIVAKALSKDVEARYQTAKELRADLAKIKEQIEIEAKTGQSIRRDEGRIHSTVGDKIHSTLGVDQSTSYGEKRRTGFASLWPTMAESGISGAPLLSRLLYPMFAVALLAAISVGAYFAFFNTTDSGRIDSIAVLPFENISGETNLNYISDGMSNALIDRFAQLPQLKVISRNSSFKFRGSNIDVKDVASQLGARAIVTGSVERSGDDIVVRVDVVDARDDRQLGGGQYRRKASDIEEVRNDIVKATVEQIKVKLTDGQSERLVDRSTENSEAYRNYLNGLVVDDGTAEGDKKALAYFEQAVALDPDFAHAYVEIAHLHYVDANRTGDPEKLVPKAKAAVERALALDGNLAKAHAVRALVYEYEFDWAAAEREYLRAIELSPNLDFARNNYAAFLSVLDRQNEALVQIEEQRIRDPLNLRLILLFKAGVFVQARRFDDALEAYRQAQEAEPSAWSPDFVIGYTYAGKGLNTEAITFFKKDLARLGEDKYSQPLVYLAIAYAKMPEKRAEARAILTRLETMNEYVSPALLSAIYTALDDNDKAMELLERAYAKRDLLLRYLKTGYEYDGLRNDPRFVDLMRRIGLTR
jgi:serine/threonine protein kinase/Tfp pilus assembly protein PilF